MFFVVELFLAIDKEVPADKPIMSRSSEVEFVHETVENIPKPVDEETQEEEALGEEHDYGEEL